MHTVTGTMSTSTEVASATTVRVELAEGRVRVHLASDAPDGAPQVRPMLLASDAWSARVALVPDGALLLADDHVRIAVEVGPGATLELVEPGGTVAYDMDGRWARWDVTVTVGAGACLLWHGEPFVVSGGAGVRRTTEVVLHEGARVGVRTAILAAAAGAPTAFPSHSKQPPCRLGGARRRPAGGWACARCSSSGDMASPLAAWSSRPRAATARAGPSSSKDSTSTPAAPPRCSAPATRRSSPPSCSAWSGVR